MTEQGIPSKKFTNVDPERIDAALRSGGILIAAVNAPILWGLPARLEEHSAEISTAGRTDHVVVVTGGQPDKQGRFTAYYINDPGTGEAARPVEPLRLFEAMRRSGSVYLEVR